MPLGLYVDVHIPRAITSGSRARGVDVITAQEDGTRQLLDPDLLDRAGELGRPLFTFDDHLLAEAHRRQGEGIAFSGVVYAHPLRVSIAKCIDDLEVICSAGEPEDVANQVIFLPV